MEKRTIELSKKDVERLQQLILEEEQYLEDEGVGEDDIDSEEFQVEQRIRSYMGKSASLLSINTDDKKIRDSWDLIREKIESEGSSSNLYDIKQRGSQNKLIWALPGVAALFLIAKANLMEESSTIELGTPSASLAESCSFWISNVDRNRASQAKIDSANGDVTIEFNCVQNGYIHILADLKTDQEILNYDLRQNDQGIYHASIGLSLKETSTVFVYQTQRKIDNKDDLINNASYIWSDVLEVVVTGAKDEEF